MSIIPVVNGMPDEDRLIPPDKRLRRLTIAAAVLVCGAGAVGLWWLAASFEGIEILEGEALRAAIDRAIRVTGVVALVSGLSLVGCGLWLFWLARRINRSGCYPPPGMKVIRTTRVRRQQRACTMANAALLGSLICVTLGVFGVWYLYALAVEALRGIAAP